ncbi:2-succinyl-5-enolpyruvyl-6-hydroxy-3-cyclohexene-1-carboxylic-acid synthase [Priestia megaterium]|nr:2-succinyl-5-enolpyruvyl-6-hydroxy-3-cyclohexene-1-carboxylic-acid synthase [Priestia megaterium]
MEHTDVLTTYIASFVDELAEAQIEDVVISPGSRSTPIAMLMAEHPHIRVHLNIDERSAGFFALGIAKAKNKPVALVCTSGTAAANYYPAVVEAHYSRVPLVVITADRPYELREVGAPQAINQQFLFGHYTKWFVDTALPEESSEMNRYIRTIAARAVSTSSSSPKGPVHVNVPLREPIVPNLSLSNLWGSEKRDKSYVSFMNGDATLSQASFMNLAHHLQKQEKGLIVCGDQLSSDAIEPISRLAQALQFPIIADPLSQLRSGTHNHAFVIDTYDSFLKSDKITDDFRPDVIIRFGAMPISKTLSTFLRAYEPREMLVVDEHDGWRDPTSRATSMIRCHERIFAAELLSHLSEYQRKSTSWSSRWIDVNHQTSCILKKLQRTEEWFEGRVVGELAELLPERAALFVGNSMPIRDIDSFFLRNSKEISIFANRGANGIDGVVSTALGVSTQYEHAVLLIGDLSFYHDLNGLLAAKMHQLNLTIVLINNDGGGIFSFLPQSKEEKHFEFLFGTPTGLQFEHAVNLYDGIFTSAKSWKEFRDAITDSIIQGGLHVIEIRTNRQQNVEIHRKIWEHVSEEINLSKYEE